MPDTTGDLMADAPADPQTLLARVRALALPGSSAFASTQDLAGLLVWAVEQLARHAAALDGLAEERPEAPAAAVLACEAMIRALHDPTPTFGAIRYGYERLCAAINVPPRKAPAPFRSLDGSLL